MKRSDKCHKCILNTPPFKGCHFYAHMIANPEFNMKKVGDMKLYSFEELLEEDYGKVGTPERDAFERSVDEVVRASHLLL